MFKQKHTKKVKYYYIGFRWIHIVLYPLWVSLFLKGEMKCTKNFVWGANFQNQKEEGRGNAKFIESCDFFIFFFSLLAMMVTNTGLASLVYNILFKKSGPCYF